MDPLFYISQMDKFLGHFLVKTFFLEEFFQTLDVSVQDNGGAKQCDPIHSNGLSRPRFEHTPNGLLGPHRTSEPYPENVPYSEPIPDSCVLMH